MKTKLSSLLLAGLLAGSGIAHAGVVVGGTRVIYDGEKKEAAIGLENPDASPYLIQSWVENEAGNSDKRSFIVTPPLFRLDAKQKNTLRIMQTGAGLPTDRETLFWLNIKSIPATEAAGQDNTLQLAINTRIKLIYRPGTLKGETPENASSQLKWVRQGQTLSVSNPTPYYINFQSVSLGGRQLDKATYVAPRSSARIELPADARSGQVEWKVISDYGAVGAAHKASL
ncbi:fimbria/pilus periplasmic chaperone [Cedecea neteri]|uniref:fimbria/pilus periplasmic chaperone n=1 Tax=Cedecea neteri TaxID=158822 RepID=UPI0005D88F41|nr:fimbria/pilus periplasmic chaperone [Cedecea neteri]AJZ89308.1 long polar fimbrial chaperone LpfB [Klebsiella michiganensis]WPU21063.1 fimbria/pilus periplasmic chaperone [Cedecea neteri]